MYRLGVSLSLGVIAAILLSVAAPHPALALPCGNNKSHNAIFGRRQTGDVLLHQDHVKMSSKWFRVVTYDIAYPTQGDSLTNSITYIEIYDQFTDGTGGCATIVSGGVGSKNVSIHLKSQRGDPLDFSVRIYGLPCKYCV